MGIPRLTTDLQSYLVPVTLQGESTEKFHYDAIVLDAPSLVYSLYGRLQRYNHATYQQHSSPPLISYHDILLAIRTFLQDLGSRKVTM